MFEALAREGSFNNKLTFEILKVIETNTAIRERNKGYLEDMAKYQNQMLTEKVLGLTEDETKQIDLLFKYAKARELAALRLLKREPEEVEVWKDDYAYKLNYL